MSSSVIRTTVEKIEFAVVRKVLGAMQHVDRVRRARAGEPAGDRSPHPEIRALLKLQQLIMPKDALTRSVASRRARARRDARVFAGTLAHVRKVSDLTLDTTPPLRARLYQPADVAGPAPLIVYFHGGGFVIGDLDTHDAPCRVLCKEARAQVLAIDYRLAPEQPFPAAVEDAVAAYAWARQHAAGLGADPARIAVAGDSAGANLATVVAQLTAQQEPPCLQLLFYPTVDRTVDRVSLELFAEGYFLTRADVEWYREQYTPNRSDLYDPRVSPLLAQDLRRQSPAIIVTAGFDPLRDEGDAYAEALRDAGNEVHVFHLTDMVHGFINMGALSGYAHATLVEVAHALRDRFGKQ
jgi:acetyl esterase